MSLALNDPDRRATLLILTWRKLTAGRKTGKLVLNKEKTELLTFKKANNSVCSLSFGNIVLEDKECHKHLDLLFQSNCKYKICRKGLETMYKSFILPQFDYANIACNNCCGTLSNMLENLLWKQ